MLQALLYLHGFRSSPASVKAQIMRGHCARRGIAFEAPDLSAAPLEAAGRIERAYARLAAQHDAVAIAGSSLGGFYGAWLAQRTGARAALINPAVRPWTVVKNYLGEQTIYGSTRTILVTPDYEAELVALRTPAFDDPSRVLLVLATGDELLDWHEAAALYAGSPSIVIDGSDHGVSDFEEHAPAVMHFLFDDAAGAVGPGAAQAG